MNSDDYIPVEGRLRGPLYSSRLFIGKNHLLKSTISGVHENYRRFAWEDIQAFTLQKTGWGGLINLFVGLMMFILFMSYLNWEVRLSVAILFHFPLFIFFTIILVKNIRKGPTCHVRIQTAVSDEFLGSLHRVNLSRRVLAQLGEIIRAKQNAEPTADAAELEIIPQTPGNPVDIAVASGRKIKKWDTGIWHAGILLLLLESLVGDFLKIKYGFDFSKPAWKKIGLMMMALSVIVIIGALVSQSMRAASNKLKVLGWVYFGYYVIAFVGVFATLFVFSIKKILHPKDYAGMGNMKAFFRLPVFSYIDAAIAIILLIFGIIALYQHRSSKPSSSPEA